MDEGSPTHGDLVKLEEPWGILAGQSIREEPSTTLTLRTFHTGEEYEQTRGLLVDLKELKLNYLFI